MKLTVPFLLLLTANAAAETVTLQPAGASRAPNVVGSQAVCKDENDFMRIARTKLDGHEVQLLADCARAHSHLVFETKSGWRTFVTAPSGGFAAMAKLKKRRFLVHRVDTYVSEDRSTSHIDLCSYDKDGTPACGSVEVECPQTGCKEPEIIKDSLWLHAKGGRQRFTIASEQRK